MSLEDFFKKANREFYDDRKGAWFGEYGWTFTLDNIKFYEHTIQHRHSGTSSSVCYNIGDKYFTDRKEFEKELEKIL